jgi:hypothetical protein
MYEYMCKSFIIEEKSCFQATNFNKYAKKEEELKLGKIFSMCKIAIYFSIFDTIAKQVNIPHAYNKSHILTHNIKRI